MIDFIINRTEESVYGYTDLNRVETAVQIVATEFPALGYPAINLEVKTDWFWPDDFDATQWPTKSQMKRYLNNIKVIKEPFPGLPDLPSTMDNLTWIGANNIERVLQEAIRRIKGIKQSYQHSGELYAGEE